MITTEGKMPKANPRNPEPKRTPTEHPPMPPSPWRFTDWAMI